MSHHLRVSSGRFAPFAELVSFFPLSPIKREKGAGHMRLGGGGILRCLYRAYREGGLFTFTMAMTAILRGNLLCPWAFAPQDGRRRHG